MCPVHPDCGTTADGEHCQCPARTWQGDLSALSRKKSYAYILLCIFCAALPKEKSLEFSCFVKLYVSFRII